MEKILEQIIEEIIAKHPTTKDELNNVRRKICGKLKMSQPSNRQLIKAYQNLAKKKRVSVDPQLEKLLRKADVRTLSGVAIITSLVKPYACPGDCVYCPTEVKMPKSYLATEPAAARALALKFDPYTQMQRRIEMLDLNGHPTDKIEYIIKGGTWNAYPLKYQYWFILESFRACNDLSRRSPVKTRFIASQPLEDLKASLEKEQEYNDKKAKHKIIGLTLETRPDAISPKTISHMRAQGCTRIELGLQAPDDTILKLVKRGHTVQQFKDAILLLRHAGFKVDLHFMPDLPGTTAEHDVEMYKTIFDDPAFKPDMVKIYPCTVIKTAELNKWYTSVKYKPYDSKDLFKALIEMKKLTPRYCRISRLIRDIPTPDIEAGNIITNLREYLSEEMKKQGTVCQCLRCREIGHNKDLGLKTADLRLFIDTYETAGGTEYFLSFEDPKRQAVFAFLRLRIPSEKNDKMEKYLPETKDVAFIRELHTYGQLVDVGKQNKKASQHKGMGKKLVKEAERIAEKNGFEKLAVISGVGVRGYYRKIGYKKRGTYMIKKI
ncbi:tRNA uridine(34) 5-carboxymethylaminomethyl modification radical SAM/GNAT enzyme Elp3 [Candidatus Parcubacteria bacterium]|nr:MAG: tRNA uridine(34) 5-carboxymethylaminomethyl modification radical SAM/GNAT enzyme Elp3 [Candidatus Parcubacteria bacterium]